MKDSDVYYNYLQDIYPDFFDENFYIDEQDGIDNVSAKLNDSLYKLFFYDREINSEYGINKVEIRGQNYSNGLFYTFFVNKEEYLLSVDYIGPSIYQAKNIGRLEEREIKNFLRTSRTLGGHMVWPRGEKLRPTINQAKGGQKGIYDRFDWTLLLLKIYYSIIDAHNKEKFMLEIKNIFPNHQISEVDIKRFEKMYEAFDKANGWLSKFGDFESFCSFFKLKGSFVDKRCKVNKLTSYFPIKPTKEGYCEYITNSTTAITKRNAVILL